MTPRWWRRLFRSRPNLDSRFREVHGKVFVDMKVDISGTKLNRCKFDGCIIVVNTMAQARNCEFTNNRFTGRMGREMLEALRGGR